MLFVLYGGGCSSSDEQDDNNSGIDSTTDVSGWYQYKTTVGSVTTTYYFEYDSSGNVLRAGTSNVEWTSENYPQLYTNAKENMSYSSLKESESSYNSLTKISTNSLPNWYKASETTSDTTTGKQPSTEKTIEIYLYNESETTVGAEIKLSVTCLNINASNTGDTFSAHIVSWSGEGTPTISFSYEKLTNDPDYPDQNTYLRYILVESDYSGELVLYLTDETYNINSSNYYLTINEKSPVTLTFLSGDNGRFYEDENKYSSKKTIQGKIGDNIDESTIPVVVAIDGYKFVEWSPALPEIFPEEDKTYKAIYEAKTYYITYHLNGGTVDGENPTSFVYRTSSIDTIQPTKTGYTFAGWSTVPNAVSSSEKDKIYLGGYTSDIDIYALWTPITYYIRFNYSFQSTGGFYAKVKYMSNELKFYSYCYTSTAADATPYSNLEYTYKALDDDSYDGWIAVATKNPNSFEDISLDEEDHFKLLDNSGNLLKNAGNCTDENGNWIGTNDYKVIKYEKSN